ncbi:MAG TPA: biotin/lipoyl-binding protein, partial [Thermoanaerobaculia bacterium]|nr:biotin/lipoyl-binding protein [Thermoanaerobaculia bacterium]
MRIRSLFMFLTILLVAACRDPSADSKPPAAATGPSEERRVAASIPEKSGLTYIGVVLTSETVNLSSELRGRLEEVSVRPGDRVSRGMALATLQPLDLPEELVSAEAAVQIARSSVSQAETALRLAKERVARVSAAPEVFSEEERSVAA